MSEPETLFFSLGIALRLLAISAKRIAPRDPSVQREITKLILVILLLALPCFAQTPNCAPAPSGLVGWWKGDGNALDSAGTNNGVLVNGAGFAPSEVGQGFSFTGPDQGVLVPDAPELDPTNAVSVEAWVLLTSYPNTEGVLVVYKNVYFGPGQYAVSVYQTGSNSIFHCSRSFRAATWPCTARRPFNSTLGTT